MKTQILIILVSLCTISGFASNPELLSEKAKMLVVQTSTWNSPNVSIRIKDMSGVIILSETVKNAKTARRYNLKNLPEGNYSIEMSNDLKITTQNFAIEGFQVRMTDEVKTEFKPILNWGEKNLDVNLMALGSKATIKILNDAGNEVFAENLQGPAVTKRYNISKLTAGEYSVIVAVNGKIYDQTFTK